MASPRLTSHRLAEQRGNSFTSPRNFNCCSNSNISLRRPSIRAESLHSVTSYKNNGKKLVNFCLKNQIENRIQTLLIMLSDSWQGSNSAEFSSSLEKIALMSRGKRVILCIGNIKKDCIFRDWQTGLHSSSFNESTNRGFSLHQKFAIVNATPLHPHNVSKSIKKSQNFKRYKLYLFAT